MTIEATIAAALVTKALPATLKVLAKAGTSIALARASTPSAHITETKETVQLRKVFDALGPQDELDDGTYRLYVAEAAKVKKHLEELDSELSILSKKSLEKKQVEDDDEKGLAMKVVEEEDRVEWVKEMIAIKKAYLKDLKIALLKKRKIMSKKEDEWNAIKQIGFFRDHAVKGIEGSFGRWFFSSFDPERFSREVMKLFDMFDEAVEEEHAAVNSTKPLELAVRRNERLKKLEIMYAGMSTKKLLELHGRLRKSSVMNCLQGWHDITMKPEVVNYSHADNARKITILLNKIKQLENAIKAKTRDLDRYRVLLAQSQGALRDDEGNERVRKHTASLERNKLAVEQEKARMIKEVFVLKKELADTDREDSERGGFATTEVAMRINGLVRVLEIVLQKRGVDFVSIKFRLEAEAGARITAKNEAAIRRTIVNYADTSIVGIRVDTSPTVTTPRLAPVAA